MNISNDKQAESLSVGDRVSFMKFYFSYSHPEWRQVEGRIASISEDRTSANIGIGSGGFSELVSIDNINTI